jgi:hypothetical protein
MELVSSTGEAGCSAQAWLKGAEDEALSQEMSRGWPWRPSRWAEPALAGLESQMQYASHRGCGNGGLIPAEQQNRSSAAVWGRKWNCGKSATPFSPGAASQLPIGPLVAKHARVDATLDARPVSGLPHDPVDCPQVGSRLLRNGGGAGQREETTSTRP